MEFRTDLADEREIILTRKQNKRNDKNKLENEKDNEENIQKIDGLESSVEKINEKITVNKVKILNESASKKLDKSIGTYTTINIKDMKLISNDDLNKASKMLSNEIIKMVENKKSILIIGLGNEDTTADSLGTKVIKDIKITRHILKYNPELLPNNSKEISAFAPGVLGNTGIETQEIVKSIVKKIQPDLVIVIDALMSTNISRLLSTIQISNTGITPGGGLGNKRKEISINTIGVPVISIGVPTLVDASTIVADSLNILIDRVDEFNKKEKIIDENTIELIKNVDYEDKYRLIKDVLEISKYNLAVMPKEIDSLVDSMNTIISSAINMALT